jgi:hypothetical protein
MLKFPCIDTIQKSSYALRFFCVQLWTTSVVHYTISKTSNPTLKKSLPMPEIDFSDVSKICSTFDDAFPKNVVEAVLQLVCNPPS